MFAFLKVCHISGHSRKPGKIPCLNLLWINYKYLFWRQDLSGDSLDVHGLAHDRHNTQDDDADDNAADDDVHSREE